LRLINIKKATADMRLARPIYQKNGSNILLNKGCNNLMIYKDKLAALGIHYAYIEDEISAGIKISDVVRESTRTKSKKIVHDAMNSVAKGKDINTKQIKNAVENMINDILKNQNILISLADVRSVDEYTFAHSVNVAVLSLILGNALQYNRYQLQKLGVGALLHDIGKAKIPGEIIHKPGKLSAEEFSLIKDHPKLGFDTVKDNWCLSPLSRIVILAHHEKVDGTGYPRRVKSEDIHDFAKIVAICDVFDALTADRCYSPKWPINEALEYLVEHSGIHFDRELTEKFIERIAAYPNGSLVTLNDGRRGIVAAQNTINPTRPIIKILEEPDKKLESTTYYDVNLLNDSSIDIVALE